MQYHASSRVNILHFSILIYHVRLTIVLQCSILLLPSTRNLIMKYTPFRANYVGMGAYQAQDKRRQKNSVSRRKIRPGCQTIGLSLVYRGATSATKRLIRLGDRTDDSRESRFRSLTIASGTLIAFKQTVSARIGARRKHLRRCNYSYTSAAYVWQQRDVRANTRHCD